MSQFDLFGNPLANPVSPGGKAVPENSALLGAPTKPPRKPRTRRVASPGIDVPAADLVPVEPATEVVSMGDWVPAPMAATASAIVPVTPPNTAVVVAPGSASGSASGSAPATPRRKPEVEVLPALAEPALLELAAHLPEGLRLGTSSWTFPGWAGLVYRDAQPETVLSRKGLSAYARHPLLRSVGIDRTFYAPLPATELAPMAAAVPEDFRFLVKAHAALTTPFDQWRRMPYAGRSPADYFLNADYAAEQVVAPVLEGLGAKTGVILFQFPPLGPPYARTALRFADHLARFLEDLPALPVDAQGRGPRYAVEIRNREFLGPAYATALGARGVVHCLNVHPRMPALAEQARLVLDGHAVAGISTRPPLTVVRWMLHPAHEYATAREEFAPFDRLAAPDTDSRSAVAAEVAAALARQDDVIVIANNKAEGSAPLTLQYLAAALVAGAEGT
jgi:uncharacterized protein YecE (DUF72 family)